MAPRILAVVLLLGPLSWIGTTLQCRPLSRHRGGAAPLGASPSCSSVDSSAVIAGRAAKPGRPKCATRSRRPRADRARATTFFPACYGMAVDYYQHQATLTESCTATTYSYEVLVGGVVAGSIAGDRLTTAPSRGTGP